MNAFSQIPDEVWEEIFEGVAALGAKYLPHAAELISRWRTPALQRDFVAELKLKRNNYAVAANFDAFEKLYPTAPGTFGDLMLPEGQAPEWRVFVLPRFLLNTAALDGLKRNIGNSADFHQIEHDAKIRQLMLLLEVDALDREVCTKVIRQSVLDVGKGWSIVELNSTFSWDSYWPGHYYLLHQMALVAKTLRQSHVQPVIEGLNRKLGKMRQDEVENYKKNFQKWLTITDQDPQNLQKILTISSS